MVVGYRQQSTNMDTDDYNGGHSSPSSSSLSSSSTSAESSSTENITNEEEEERNTFERVEHVMEWNDVNRNIIAINEVQLEDNGVIFDDYNHPLIDMESMHNVVFNDGDIEKRLLDQKDSTIVAYFKAVTHKAALMVQPK